MLIFFYKKYAVICRNFPHTTTYIIEPDFTYMWLEDGAKRYNCTIIDLFDRSPVATLNSNRINAELAIETLKIALNHNKIKDGFILHSDQGTQFTSRDFTEFCSLQNITQSMSKAGYPYDNAQWKVFMERSKQTLYIIIVLRVMRL